MIVDIHSQGFTVTQVRMSDALVATVLDIAPHTHDVVYRATDRVVARLVSAYLDR